MSEAIELYNSATFRVITDDQNPGKSEIGTSAHCSTCSTLVTLASFPTIF